MAGDVRAPISGDNGSKPFVIIESTGTELDGKRAELIAVVDPATGLPASFGAVGVSGGSMTVADGADVAQGARADVAGTTTVVGQLKAIAAALAVPNSYTRSDTYTTATSGTTVDASANPPSAYSLMVKGTGATASAWSVVLEGSLTGAAGTWTTLLTHGTSDGDGATKSVADLPTRFVRTRLASVTLGSASNVVARLLAVR